MPIVTFDVGQTVTATENNGIIRGYKRVAKVTGLIGTGSGIAGEAVNAVQAENPLFYSAFSRHEVYPFLVLTGREFVQKTNMADGTSHGEVRLSWIHESDLDNQFIFSGGSKAVQILTQRDRFGEPIVLQHTFLEDDEQFPGVTRTQGGDIKVDQSQMFLKATGVLEASFPDRIANYWFNSLNVNWWVSGAPGTWKCIVADYQPYDTSLSVPKWLFTFAFQFNPDGWDPSVTYIDSRTNKPPVGIVPGLGSKIIEYHDRIDFTEIFNVGV